MTCLPLPFAGTSVLNTHVAFRFRNSLCGGGRLTCLPFAGTSVMNTHKAFRFCNSLCGGACMTSLPFPFACTSVINTYGVPVPQLTLGRRPRDLFAACTSVMNTRSASQLTLWRTPLDLSAIPIRLYFRYEHKAFCFRNSLCGGGRYLPFPVAVMNTRIVFRFCNSPCGGDHVTCLPLPFICNSLSTYIRHSTSTTLFPGPAHLTA